MRLVDHVTSYKLTVEWEKKTFASVHIFRVYGSRRFLQVRISEDLLRKENDPIRAFFVAKFILCGRVFVPFHSKDSINWHNPKKTYFQVHTLPRSQLDPVLRCILMWATGKYSSRFVLGLSSYRVCDGGHLFHRRHRCFPLQCSYRPPAREKGKATDRCGLINHKALITIVRLFNYDSLPAGVQGRIDGSKCFWILHPTDDSDVLKIWIRDS
jgi:hypothetical protein